jgi:hypothetical protein
MLVAFTLAITVFRPPLTPGPFERDFEAYYAAGATVNAGGDPYSRDLWQAEREIRGVVATRDELLPYVGPAAALPLWSLLARAPQPVALVIWSAILTLAFAALVLAILTLAGAPRSPAMLLATAVFAFANGPMFSDVALGQVALVSVAAIACALVAYRARSPLGAGLTTLLAAIQPNLALVLIARMRSRFDLIVASIAAGAFALITLVAGGGVARFHRYLTRLQLHGEAERFILIQHTPQAIAFAFGLPRATALSVGTTIAIAAIIGGFISIVRNRLNPTHAALLACALAPLALPFFHEHDFTLELIPAGVLALRARGRARTLAAIACALVLVDWLGLAQRPPAHAQIFCLALTVMCAFIAIGNVPAADQRRGLWGIAAATAIFLIASPLAHRFPAPTWPDTLSLTYRAEPTADASAVWAEEQRLAGLETVEPFWGALRALPLCGCVLLAFAITAHARKPHLSS